MIADGSQDSENVHLHPHEICRIIGWAASPFVFEYIEASLSAFCGFSQSSALSTNTGLATAQCAETVGGNTRIITNNAKNAISISL